MKVLVTHSCLTLCDPMDCSLPGFSVHGILQTIILEWVAIPFSRGSSWPRNQTQVSCTPGRFFTIWPTREASSFIHVVACVKIFFFLKNFYCSYMGLPVAQTGKNLPAMREIWVWSLSSEDPQVRKIPWRRAWQPTAILLPGECPWTEEPGGLQSMGLQRVRNNWATKHSLSVYTTFCLSIHL